MLACLLTGSAGLSAQPITSANLLLVPEKTNFVKTSAYADVIAFLDNLKATSPALHVFSMGKSPEGKDIPVAVLAQPPVTSPQQAKASGKLVVYVQANIHAGEVEGKEALMMLMRDISLGDKKYWLDRLVILLAPIFNTDSNDKMEKGRRPSQEDSPLEVGLRENSQGLDLNRDGVKMEALETNHLFQNVVVPWDPQVVADLHTTNGTWHTFNLTHAPAYHYAGLESTHAYTKSMLNAIDATVKEKYNLHFGPYGDYDVRQGWPPKNFYTYNHHPRYLINQFSLRNRIAILSEAFAHERFYQRIFSTYAFVTEILEYAYRHHTEIAEVNRLADLATVAQAQQAGQLKKGVRYKMVPYEKFLLPTYDYLAYQKDDGSTGYYRTGRVSQYEVQYHAAFQAEAEATWPKGYIIPAQFGAVAENLRKHGVVVTQLDKKLMLSGEEFVAKAYTKAERKFEGHFMARVTGQYRAAKKSFAQGDYRVELAQPLGHLAFYLLEPESDDGYITWNFFDAHFDKNPTGIYPVFKFY
jgi:hypothetical protein